MQWNSVQEFFAMGGYAFYVWGSFGITAVAMLIEMQLVRSQRAAIVRSIRAEAANPIA
jgi:heme exporter protein D